MTILHENNSVYGSAMLQTSKRAKFANVHFVCCGSGSLRHKRPIFCTCPCMMNSWSV